MQWYMGRGGKALLQGGEGERRQEGRGEINVKKRINTGNESEKLGKDSREETQE
jgi:hypothetical protein